MIGRWKYSQIRGWDGDGEGEFRLELADRVGQAPLKRKTMTFLTDAGLEIAEALGLRVNRILRGSGRPACSVRRARRSHSRTGSRRKARSNQSPTAPADTAQRRPPARFPKPMPAPPPPAPPRAQKPTRNARETRIGRRGSDEDDSLQDAVEGAAADRYSDHVSNAWSGQQDASMTTIGGSPRPDLVVEGEFLHRWRQDDTPASKLQRRPPADSIETRFPKTNQTLSRPRSASTPVFQKKDTEKENAAQTQWDEAVEKKRIRELKKRDLEYKRDWLATVPLFDGMAAAETIMSQLAKMLEPRDVPAGTAIITMGDTTSTEMYFIREGQAEVLLELDEAAVAVLGPGQFFGEEALLTASPRSAHIMAATSMMVYTLEKAGLRSVFREFPGLEEIIKNPLDERRRVYIQELEAAVAADAAVEAGRAAAEEAAAEERAMVERRREAERAQLEQDALDQEERRMRLEEEQVQADFVERQRQHEIQLALEAEEQRRLAGEEASAAEALRHEKIQLEQQRIAEAALQAAADEAEAAAAAAAAAAEAAAAAAAAAAAPAAAQSGRNAVRRVTTTVAAAGALTRAGEDRAGAVAGADELSSRELRRAEDETRFDQERLDEEERKKLERKKRLEAIVERTPVAFDQPDAALDEAPVAEWQDDSHQEAAYQDGAYPDDSCRDSYRDDSYQEAGEAGGAGQPIEGTYWVQYFDEEGTPYFFNTFTEETAWEHPTEGLGESVEWAAGENETWTGHAAAEVDGGAGVDSAAAPEQVEQETVPEEAVVMEPVEPLEPPPDKQMDFGDMALTVDDFTVGVVLGRGSFGVVRHAQINGGGFYALKTIKKDWMAEPADQRHLLDERKVLSCVHHPNVVNLHGTFQDSTTFYLCMEYVPGGELLTVLKDRKGTLQVPTARFVLGQLAAAVVGYLHWPLSVAHRDIKPENILLTERGDIKLADFRLAKQLQHDERCWTACGTPEYMAPVKT